MTTGRRETLTGALFGALAALVVAVPAALLVDHWSTQNIQAAAGWTAAAGGIGALGYLGWQARLANRVAILQAHNALTSHSIELNRRFRDEQGLFPYFFENTALSPAMDRDLEWEVIMTTDAFADYIEAIALHAALLPSERFDTWHEFCIDVISRSPTLRSWLEDNSEWYSPEAAELLRRGEERNASRAGAPNRIVRYPAG